MYAVSANCLARKGPRLSSCPSHLDWKVASGFVFSSVWSKEASMSQRLVSILPKILSRLLCDAGHSSILKWPKSFLHQYD